MQAAISANRVSISAGLQTGNSFFAGNAIDWAVRGVGVWRRTPCGVMTREGAATLCESYSFALFVSSARAEIGAIATKNAKVGLNVFIEITL